MATTADDQHAERMRALVDFTATSFSSNPSPFGASIYEARSGKLVSQAFDTVLQDCDPTKHGEMNAIREAAQGMKRLSLRGCILYSTCEPCPMCMSACIWAEVGTVVYGASTMDQSQRDLQERLVLEAELVPCPKCNWINEELVQGYRLGRYRRAGMLAMGVGLCGMIGSLICAWFILVGPAADRVALPYFLFGGPVLFVSLALGMILLRCWMRSRIQPNRNFPLTPTLPGGSPPALIENQSTGEIEEATRQDDRFTPAGAWHEFQIGRHELPQVCCDCLKSASLEYAFNCPIAATIELKVPRCPECARESRRSYRRIWWTTAATSLLVGSGLSVLLRLESIEFWILIASLFLISLALASYVASKMTSPVRLGGGDYSRGFVKLRFRNPEYGAAVKTQLQRLSNADE